MPSRKVKPLRQTGLGKLGVTLQIKQVHDLHVSVIGWRQLELPEGCTSMHYRVHILEAKHPKRVFAQLSQDRPRVSSEFDKFSQLYRPMPDTDLSEGFVFHLGKLWKQKERYRVYFAFLAASPKGILTRTVSFGLENVIDGGLRGDATWFWLLPGLQGLQHCAPAPTESHLLQPDGRGGLSGESNGVVADPRCDVKVTGRLVEFANAHICGTYLWLPATHNGRPVFVQEYRTLYLFFTRVSGVDCWAIACHIGSSAHIAQIEIPQGIESGRPDDPAVVLYGVWNVIDRERVQDIKMRSATGRLAPGAPDPGIVREEQPMSTAPVLPTPRSTALLVLPGKFRPDEAVKASPSRLSWPERRQVYMEEQVILDQEKQRVQQALEAQRREQQDLEAAAEEERQRQREILAARQYNARNRERLEALQAAERAEQQRLVARAQAQREAEEQRRLAAEEEARRLEEEAYQREEERLEAEEEAKRVNRARQEAAKLREKEARRKEQERVRKDSLRRQQSIEKRDSLRREKQQRDEEKAAEQERLRRERVARLEVGLVSQDPHTFQLNNPLRSSTRRPTGESAGQAAVVESTAF